jgi:hypothetical protein
MIRGRKTTHLTPYFVTEIGPPNRENRKVQKFMAFSFLRKLFFRAMSGSVLLHPQRSPQDLQQLLAWYKVRDTFLGLNCVGQDIKKALELASVYEHPDAVWLTKLFGGRDVDTMEEARRVFCGYENDQLFALLVSLFAILLRWVELLILAMRLLKR